MGGTAGKAAGLPARPIGTAGRRTAGLVGVALGRAAGPSSGVAALSTSEGGDAEGAAAASLEFAVRGWGCSAGAQEGLVAGLAGAALGLSSGAAMPAVGDGVATGEEGAGPDPGARAPLPFPAGEASGSGLAGGVLSGDAGDSACEGEEAKSGSEGPGAGSSRGEEAEAGAKGVDMGSDKGEDERES